MFINEPVLKGNKKKPKTVAKNIDQYQFSSPLQRNKQQSSVEKPNSSSSKSNQQIKALKTKIMNTTLKNNSQFFIERDKNYFQGETEFEFNLVEDLNLLIKKWQDNLNTVESDLKPYDIIGQSVSQVRAFEHCVNLLQAQLSQGQSSHQSTQNLINKKILQIDDYKLRILKQIKELHTENEDLIKQNQRLEQEEKQAHKQATNKKVMQQRIQQEKQKVQKLKASLLQCKQDSYGQKNQFIQIQSQQFRLESQINQIEQLQRKDEQQNIRAKKYNQLFKIKQKILHARESIQEQVRPHLQRKIQKMAKLRSELKSLDEALQTCCIKAQDQNIIIQALKQKSYHQEAYQQDEQDLYEVYRKKYSEIYFGDKSDKSSKGENSDWKDYNTYLQHLISKNKELNSRVYTQIPKYYSKRKPISMHINDNDGFLNDQYLPSKKNSRIGKNILDLRPNNFSKRDTRDKFFGNGNNSTKISQNPENYKSQRIPSKKRLQTDLKLPRLVKIQGKANEQSKIKNKVKQGILKNNNKQSDFELQSIHSNDSKVSGQIIQVQFHKK